MKTVLGNIATTATQKEAILNHAYLQDSENGFSFTFSIIENPEINPFGDLGENYTMTAELDAMGWICIGQIFSETK